MARTFTGHIPGLEHVVTPEQLAAEEEISRIQSRQAYAERRFAMENAAAALIEARRLVEVARIGVEAVNGPLSNNEQSLRDVIGANGSIWEETKWIRGQIDWLLSLNDKKF